MILNDISVINYKNIATAQLSFTRKINCLLGNNGVGKTNMLDAIYYLSFCHSSFTNVDATNVRHEQDFFVIDGNYTTPEGEPLNVNVGMRRGQRKHFRKNKKEYKRYAEHIGLIPLVFISPADHALVDGGGEERRKLVDVVVSQIDRNYLDDLMTYNKVLQQRNTLLRAETEPDVALMDVLEQQMAMAGERVFHRRAEMVEAMVPVFQDIYRRVSGNRETVSLRYISHCQRGPLIDVIRQSRVRDRAVGYSLHGIHRDDLEMLIEGYPMRREGSQGQTKTFVLALKLAQFDFLRRASLKLHSAQNEDSPALMNTPLLLLDDIFDKLDAQRVEQIVELVSGDSFGQIFITDTNRDHLDRILKHNHHEYALFDVADGEVKRRDE